MMAKPGSARSITCCSTRRITFTSSLIGLPAQPLPVVPGQQEAHLEEHPGLLLHQGQVGQQSRQDEMHDAVIGWLLVGRGWLGCAGMALVWHGNPPSFLSRARARPR